LPIPISAKKSFADTDIDIEIESIADTDIRQIDTFVKTSILPVTFVVLLVVLATGNLPTAVKI
jgi:hypothetical protein